MLKRGYKLIICVVLVSALFIGLESAFASADVLGGAGFLGSALGSIGVDLLAGGSATVATLAPWLNGEYSIRGVLTGVADGFIKVNDDSVIIDGVEYQSIFLDPSMALELHTQAFDFITQKAITSNSSGILASGVGTYAGVPIYNTGSAIQSQFFSISADGSYVTGDITTTCYYRSGLRETHYELSGAYTDSGWISRNYPFSLVFKSISLTKPYSFQHQFISPSGNVVGGGNGSGIFIDSPFNYSYVSGSIDATPLPTNYGFSAYVPKSDLVAGNVVAGTYYNNDPVGLDIVNKLIDILDQAYSNESIQNVEWAEESQPVPPVPTTTIADTAYSDLHAEMTDIKNNQAHANTAIDNIDSNIDIIGRTVDHLDETVTDIEGYIQTGTSDIIVSVDTAGQSVVDGLSDVEGAIDTAGQSIVDGLSDVEGAIDTAGQSVVDSVDAQTQALEQSISDVADKVESLDSTVDQVIEKVESHPLDLFGAFLDRLTQIPVIKDLFDGIKRHVGIWHYVVEWLQCIGTFLAFFIGLFSDVAYCMVVPIYACVAGAICLAFYKRFGR